MQAVKPHLYTCPSSRVWALEVCYFGERERQLVLTHTLSLEYCFCGLSVLSRQGVGRKEGRESERQRGDELFEAERVVKLRLVQTKTGETRQLWKSGRGQPQVSLSLWSKLFMGLNRKMLIQPYDNIRLCREFTSVVLWIFCPPFLCKSTSICSRQGTPFN